MAEGPVVVPSTAGVYIPEGCGCCGSCFCSYCTEGCPPYLCAVVTGGDRFYLRYLLSAVTFPYSGWSGVSAGGLPFRQVAVECTPDGLQVTVTLTVNQPFSSNKWQAEYTALVDVSNTCTFRRLEVELALALVLEDTHATEDPPATVDLVLSVPVDGVPTGEESACCYFDVDLLCTRDRDDLPPAMTVLVGGVAVIGAFPIPASVPVDFVGFIPAAYDFCWWAVYSSGVVAFDTANIYSGGGATWEGTVEMGYKVEVGLVSVFDHAALPPLGRATVGVTFWLRTIAAPTGGPFPTDWGEATDGPFGLSYDVRCEDMSSGSGRPVSGTLYALPLGLTPPIGASSDNYYLGFVNALELVDPG